MDSAVEIAFADAPVLDDQRLADPYALFDALRAAGPVRPVILPDGNRAWFVTRYAEARQALADPRLVKDEAATAAVLRSDTAGLVRLPAAIGSHLRSLDVACHRRLRKLIGSAFSMRALDRLRPRIKAITAGLLDGMADGETDLVEAFARPLSLAVSGDLFGLTAAQWERLRELVSPAAGVGRDEPRRGTNATAGELVAFLDALVAEKRVAPGDDVFSAMVRANDDGDRLDDAELVSIAFLMLTVGQETAVNLLAGGTLALLRHPDQLARLRDQPGLIKKAVEELLRYEGPINTAMPRLAKEDVTIGGVRILQGQVVMVGLLAANRDERRFARPAALDIGRRADGQLQFSHGVYFSLGAPLARLEAEIAFRAMFDRFPALRLADPGARLRYRPGSFFRALEALPVRVG